ncbi:unnamed protein product [Vitrella brassicaformis CCMP3155]|uniref:Chromo domain-containing protein n=2 Tax=Vitrella brassicaformis TaxID=1169539 RepID=A0A0G4EX78_VITBC|nr:unnamed protein product [Vitrella brassicaformis CCMP3155]|eukprot:CEM02700.1 unnamed protein product [Vitrella brassicaformis CCMP3155]
MGRSKSGAAAADDKHTLVYEVENVVDFDIRDGKPFYLLRWKGWPETDNSWEPEENLTRTPKMVEWMRRAKKKRGVDDDSEEVERKKTRTEDSPWAHTRSGAAAAAGTPAVAKPPPSAAAEGSVGSQVAKVGGAPRRQAASPKPKASPSFAQRGALAAAAHANAVAAVAAASRAASGAGSASAAAGGEDTLVRVVLSFDGKERTVKVEGHRDGNYILDRFCPKLLDRESACLTCDGDPVDSNVTIGVLHKSKKAGGDLNLVFEKGEEW